MQQCLWEIAITAIASQEIKGTAKRKKKRIGCHQSGLGLQTSVPLLPGFYSRALFLQALGLSNVAFAIAALRMPKLPYGWQGKPLAGYLTGPSKTIIALVVLAFGLASIFVPDAVAPYPWEPFSQPS